MCNEAFRLGFAAMMFVTCCLTLDATANRSSVSCPGGWCDSYSAGEPSPSVSGKNQAAQPKEGDDYVEYRAGPSDEETDDLRRKEEEKEAKSWEMLMNMIIMFENEQKPSPPRYPSPFPHPGLQ
jgi:hypothetical protein